MFKLLIGLIAFFCFVSPSTATNVTQIQITAYSDNACTTPRAVVNFTSGECIYNAVSYYHSTDNAFVYSYQFTTVSTGCAVDNISVISKIDVGVCGATAGDGTTFTMYTVFPNVEDPAPPTDFPPTGFSVSTQYLNLTTAKAADTCDTTRTVSYASPNPGPCQKLSSGLFSYQTFFDPTCTNSVTVMYSDPNCSNIVRVFEKVIEFPACNFGFKNVCPGTPLPSFPSTLSIGYTQFDNDQCITNSQTRQTVVVPGVCYNSQTMTCAMVNGTETLIATSYTNPNCTGSITRTAYAPTGVCLNTAMDPNMLATCHAGPITPIIVPPSSSTGSISGSSSTGGAGGSSSSGPNGSVGRSISISSLMMIMIFGFITIKMNN